MSYLKLPEVVKNNYRYMMQDCNSMLLAGYPILFVVLCVDRFAQFLSVDDINFAGEHYYLT